MSKLKINLLLFFDGLLLFVAIPVVLIARSIQFFISSKENKNNNKVLVIKFMGAGNLVALATLNLPYQIDFLTTQQLVVTEKFYPKNPPHFFALNISSLALFIQSLIKVCNVFRQGKYLKIINLESESILARIFIVLIPSQKKLGITNIYRSWIDYLVYDKYYVGNELTKVDMFTYLVNEFTEPYVNENSFLLLKFAQNEFKKNYKMSVRPQKIVVTPTCSELDKARRLSVEEWGRFFNSFKMFKDVQCIVLFSSDADFQFNDFKLLKNNFQNLSVIVTDYDEFVINICNAELLITVDSQALHIAQLHDIPTICFYGPTSPFGVSIKSCVYPISNSFVCSPCTHKYFKKPCGDALYCNKSLTYSDLCEFFNKIEWD